MRYQGSGLPGLGSDLVEVLPDGLLVCDGDGRIVLVNQRLEEISGYPREELLGETVELLVPDESREPHARDRRRLAPCGGARHMGKGEPVSLRRKDGVRVSVDVALASREMDGRFLFVALIRDDSARRDAEDRRRRSEARVRRALEERYRKLVEAIPGIVHISRLDATASTIYISPEVERVLGFAPHEWEADPELWVRLLHPEDRERAMAANERFLRDHEPFVLDYRMVARDGRIVWLHEESEVVHDEEGRPLYAQGVMFDVTERKLAEEEARAHLQQLEALVELSQLALPGDSLDRLLARASELVAEVLDVEYAMVLELSPAGDELLLRAGVGWREGLVGRATVPAGLESQAGFTLASDEPIVVQDLAAERRFRAPDLLRHHGVVSGLSVAIRRRERPFGVLGAYTRRRRTFPPSAVGWLASVAGVLAQAIERAEADRLVRDRERRLAEAQRIAHLGSWEWDPETDRAVWSEEVFRILGLDPEGGPLSWEGYLELIHEEDRDRVDAAIREALGKGGAYAVDYRVRRPDGTERVVHEQGRVDLEAEGTSRVVGTVLDVTELRRAEQELAHSLERLRRTDAERRRLLAHLVQAREEERARIAADIHDDPLQKVAALKLRVGLLRELATTPRQEEQLDVLDRTIGQVIASLRGLLFELRPITLDRDGLAAALRELLQRAGEEAGFGFALRDELEAEPPLEVRVVCYRIAQEAIANVRKHAQASFIEVHLASEGSGTRVRIRDDGRGFDPARIPPRPGHLGLPDMRERAELAGGWLRVESAPGAGTTVEFWIPA